MSYLPLASLALNCPGASLSSPSLPPSLSLSLSLSLSYSLTHSLSLSLQVNNDFVRVEFSKAGHGAWATLSHSSSDTQPMGAYKVCVHTHTHTNTHTHTQAHLCAGGPPGGPVSYTHTHTHTHTHTQGRQAHRHRLRQLCRPLSGSVQVINNFLHR